MEIIGQDITSEEKQLLGCFTYSNNKTYVHSDPDLMPKNKSAWTSWNYLGNTRDSIGNSTNASSDTANAKSYDARPVYVTYWLNKLQKLSHNKDIFVSLNPNKAPVADKTYTMINYAHPQYTINTIQAQKNISMIQGKNNLYYCGAWMGYGFHEDGFRSGIEVAIAISNEPTKWMKKFGSLSIIPGITNASTNSIILKNKSQTNNGTIITTKTNSMPTFPLLSLLLKSIVSPIYYGFECICQHQICQFLSKNLQKGKLTMILPNNKTVVFQGKDEDLKLSEEVVLHVFNNNFFVRLALEADIGK